MKTKKVILFLVEGYSDERALAGIIEKILSSEDMVSFQIVETDITSDQNVDANNIEKEIIRQVEDKCKKEGFWHSDIAKVVQLIDMDGACVDDACVVEAIVDDPQYDDVVIKTKYVEKMRERNHRKSSIIKKISGIEKLVNEKKEEYP